ncbi:OsmC family protein [Micromonospora sp. CA-263727]|uniref:OsmC family protein n=1 Tax=Micromonospora sp. CA-263727 TaxID=3239967 RepID=UPI003D92AFE6
MSTTVHATSSLDFGRFVLTSRTNHLVVDASERRGGTGEAIQPVEVFLASLATCTASSFQYWAREQGNPVGRVEVTVTGETVTEPVGFSGIHITVSVTGITQGQLADIAEAYRTTCPIYSTIAATVPVEVELRILA